MSTIRIMLIGDGTVDGSFYPPALPNRWPEHTYMCVCMIAFARNNRGTGGGGRGAAREIGKEGAFIVNPVRCIYYN